MNCLKYLTAAAVCLISSIAVCAQDRIYLENAVYQGKVNDISFGTIRYSLADKPGQRLLLPMYKVFILFNSDGGYLVPSVLDSASPNLKSYVNRFLSPGPHLRTKDQIFTTHHTLVEEKVVKEDDDFVYLADHGKMSKKDVAVIIHSDGTPELNCPAAQAAQVLGACQQTPLNLGIGSDVVVNNGGTGVTGGNGSTGGTGTTGDADPVVQTGGDGNAAATDDEPDSLKAKVKALLGNVRPEEFTNKAEKKTLELTGYLTILCDKKASPEDLDKAVSQALTLFINDSAVVEVSSANRNSISRKPIREYLYHLKRIQYDKIEVKWTHVQYVSELKPGPDGRLYGTVSFEQEFKGYKDGKLVYSDVTIKHANVVLVTYQKVTEGTAQQLWDVRLSDIGVVATKS